MKRHMVTDSRRWWVLAVVGLAQFIVLLDSTVVNIALPSAQRALGMTVADRQWVITAYAVTFGGLLLLGGRLSDVIGRKRSIVVGVIGFAAASALAVRRLLRRCCSLDGRHKASSRRCSPRERFRSVSDVSRGQ